MSWTAEEKALVNTEQLAIDEAKASAHRLEDALAEINRLLLTYPDAGDWIDDARGWMDDALTELYDHFRSLETVSGGLAVMQQIAGGVLSAEMWDEVMRYFAD